MSKIVQNIINSSKSVIGLKPKAYYAYRSDITLTIEDNKVTAVTAGILGVIEGCKNFINKGHEEVAAEDNYNGFKQKFNAIVNAHSAVVDMLDDVVLFVESNAGVKYVLGAKYGLWKASQAQMSNDNLATIAVELSSREGIEESYSEYILTADISGIPTTENFEDVASLTIGSGAAVEKKVYLEVDSDLDCYVVLPDKTVLSSTSGIVNTTWDGAIGKIKLVIPKGDIETKIDSASPAYCSDYLGEYICNNPGTFSAAGSLLTSIVADSKYAVSVGGSLNLTNLSCKKSVATYASNCPNLSQASIKRIIDDAVTTGENNGTIDLGSSTAVEVDDISAIHGKSYQELLDDLDSAGWSLTYELSI